LISSIGVFKDAFRSELVPPPPPGGVNDEADELLDEGDEDDVVEA
jgi:hypothetical protein